MFIYRTDSSIVSVVIYIAAKWEKMFWLMSKFCANQNGVWFTTYHQRIYCNTFFRPSKSPRYAIEGIGQLATRLFNFSNFSSVDCIR